MKKTLLLSALILGLTCVGSANAITLNAGGVKLNVNTPNVTTKNTTSTTTKTSENVQKMKAQIDALNNKLNSISANYKTNIDSLANNILSTDELEKYKNKVENLKASGEKGAELNIDIAEDGTIILNSALKSNSNDLKNLTSAKKASIKKSLTNLKSVASSYNSLGTDMKNLIASIKNDPVTALTLHSELMNLNSNMKEVVSQAKNITNLTTNLTTALAKAGVNVK